MSEGRTIVNLDSFEQSSAATFSEVVTDLDDKLWGFSTDQSRLVELLIPQRAPVDRKPMYPTISMPLSVEVALDEIVGIDRDPSVDERGRKIFSIASTLGPSAKELEEARKNPVKLKDIYTKPEVMHDIRLLDFLLDTNRANILGLWATMSDENFQKFLDLVSESKLPKCLTSDLEMRRLLNDINIIRESKATERSRLTSARERLVDLVLNPVYYVKDETGHAITPQIGGSKQYEFDQNINIVSVMDQLRQEFPEEEK